MTGARPEPGPAGAWPDPGPDLGSPAADLGWRTAQALAARFGAEAVGSALERAVDLVMYPPLEPSLDASGLTKLLTAVPWAVLSGAVVATLGTAVVPSPAGPLIAVAVWLGGGALVLDRRVEALMVRLMFRGRRPTPAEQAVLDEAWSAVANRAGVDPGRFELWVETSEALNAYAAGGRVIMVTTAATDLALPSLEAILAHELGHHAHGHSWANLVSAYLSFPGRLFATGVLTVAEAVSHLDRVFAAAVKAAAVTMVLVAPWTVLFIVLPPVQAAADRRSEFASDRYAADLGYGADLLALLGWFAERQAERVRAGRPTVAESLLDHHPSLRRRIVALARHLALGALGQLDQGPGGGG